MLLPNPSLKRLWLEASAAERLIEQIRTLEESWASLLDTISDLPILHEDDLVRPLTDFLGIDAPLAGAVARTVLKDTANSESRTRQAIRRHAFLPAEGLPSGEATTAATLLRWPPPFAKAARTQARPFAEGTTNRAPRESIGHTSEDAARSPRTLPERRAPSDALAITREAASQHFREIFERAGVRSAWDERVVAPSCITPVVDALVPPLKAVAHGDAPASKHKRALPHVGFNTEPHASSRASSSQEIIPVGVQANAHSRPSLVAQTAAQTIASEFVAEDAAARSEDGLTKILRPLIERVERSAKPLSPQEKLASHVAAAYRSSDSVDVEFSRSIPLTGLRRLAAGTPRAGERYRPSTTADELARIAEPSSDFLEGREGGEFASQLAELLRRESLRLGIGVEEF